VRLGTASLRSEPGGPFINLDQLDYRKYAQRPSLAKVLCDYAYYVEHNPKKAIELCALATEHAQFQDWWWKTRLGKGYYQLQMFREAEQQYRSSIRDQDMVVTNLELAKIFVRLDQPKTALEVYGRAHEEFPGEVSLMLGMARIYDALNDTPEGVKLYQKVLHFEASNPEALACLAANQFYSDQPELALRYYRRLLHMGLGSTELWNNIGLSCYLAGQYDMCLTCFERALKMGDDDNSADVWYNIGQLAIGIGDQGLAYQAAKIAVSIDNRHAESFNNLAVFELKKGNIEQARSGFMSAETLNPMGFESFYNHGDLPHLSPTPALCTSPFSPLGTFCTSHSPPPFAHLCSRYHPPRHAHCPSAKMSAALLTYKLGEFQEAFELANKTLQIFPTHTETKELLRLLKHKFDML